jgi:hypothetical protein
MTTTICPSQRPRQKQSRHLHLLHTLMTIISRKPQGSPRCGVLWFWPRMHAHIPNMPMRGRVHLRICMPSFLFPSSPSHLLTPSHPSSKPFLPITNKTNEPKEPKAVTIAESISVDPAAWSKNWQKEIVQELGGAKAMALQLQGIECQDGLIAKISDASTELEECWQAVRELGPAPAADALSALILVKGDGAVKTLKRFLKIASSAPCKTKTRTTHSTAAY